jgi:hypothetical protein
MVSSTESHVQLHHHQSSRPTATSQLRELNDTAPLIVTPMATRPDSSFLLILQMTGSDYAWYQKTYSLRSLLLNLFYRLDYLGYQSASHTWNQALSLFEGLSKIV